MVDVSKLRAQAQFDLCHKGPTQVPTMTLIELLNRLEELERQLASKEGEIRALSGPRRMALHNDDGETYRAPPGGWTCFHCGEVLETEHEARAHFGGDPQATPTCQELALEAESYKLAAQAANQLLEATRAEREGMALVPREITAETGHKAGMLGDFHESVLVRCPDCDNDQPNPDCEICDGLIEYEEIVAVSWTTIKAIHRRIVEISEARQAKEGQPS